MTAGVPSGQQDFQARERETLSEPGARLLILGEEKLGPCLSQARTRSDVFGFYFPRGSG